MKLAKLAPITLVLLLLIGCNDPYGTCAKGSTDVATAIGQAENGIDTARTQGQLTVAEEKAVLGYLNFANTLNGQFQTCVKGVHTAASGAVASAYTGCVTTFSTGLANPTELAEIKVVSAQGQATVQGIVTSIQNAVLGIDTALSAISASKGAQ